MDCVFSIVIPTYNRVDELRLNLQHLCPQAIWDKMEVVVCDNASTDSTSEMVRELQREYPIRYFRQESNVGPDRNFLSAYRIAKGDYVMLLGDDDIMLPGAVQSILECLDCNPDILYLNTCGMKQGNSLDQLNPPVMAPQGVLEYSSREEFIKKVGIYITFLSGMVLRRGLVLQISNPEQYIGTYFIQSYIAFAVIKNSSRCVINTFVCVAATQNIVLNYDLYFVWGKQYKALIYDGGLSAGLSQDTLNEVYYNSLKTSILYDIYFFRYTCPNSDKWDQADMLECINQYPDLQWRFKLAMNVPRLILPILRRLHFLVNLWI